MKRIIALILCAVMLALSLCVTSFAQTIKKDDSFKIGDADKNGSVNAVDALLIKAKLAQVEGYKEPDSQAADLDADGYITAKDAFYVKRALAGGFNLSTLENGKQCNTFIIGGVDISQFTAVLPDDTDDNTNLRFAYDLLEKYTEIATGVSLPVEYGTQPEHAVYLNHPESGSQLEADIGDDGFRYEVINGDLYIWGGMRGNMYAVYDILEEHLGFYFMDNYYTFEYKVRCANLYEGLSKQFVPPFTYRGHVGTIWGSTTDYYAVARKLNFSTIGSKTVSDARYGYFVGPLYHNAHSFYFYEAMGAGIMPDDDGVMTLADRYYKKYEDGLAHGVEREIVPNQHRMEGDGPTAQQPCASSTDEFENVFRGYVDTIRFIEARGYVIVPGTSYVSFSINDSSAPDGGYCQCRICKAKANGTKVGRVNQDNFDEIVANYSGEYTYEKSGTTYNVTFKKESYSGVYIDFANKALRKLRAEYPEYADVISNMILYDHTVPESVRPDSHLVLFYCGNGCNQHALGSGKCTGRNGYTNEFDEVQIPQWADICHQAGTKLFFWYYPVSFSIMLYDAPCIFNTYYDFHWLYENGVDGIYDESDRTFTTEPLKGYLGMEMIWNPAMSYDEFIGLMKKYLYAYYGNGWEEIYDTLVLLDEAGDANDGCFYPAFHRIFDEYSPEYLAAHYDEIHSLMQTARNKSDDSGRVKALYYSCEFLCLSSNYDDMYVNGSTDERNLWEERYTALYNYLKDEDVMIDSAGNYALPETLDFSVNPAIQFFSIVRR